MFYLYIYDSKPISVHPLITVYYVYSESDLRLDYN